MQPHCLRTLCVLTLCTHALLLLLFMQINIVMDYASGGSLFTYVQTRNRLREPLARYAAPPARLHSESSAAAKVLGSVSSAAQMA